ncbi:MAG TPA: hypothetical protein VJB66_05430 [Candidatus Nanoarchaeia archaeon]|nr:hypothetical protein [Candidatus Nanoarchaeia archaeon]
MNVRYTLSQTVEQQSVPGIRSFIVGNDDCYYLHDQMTRFGGWFVRDRDQSFRVLAEIRGPTSAVQSIHHKFYSVEQERSLFRESFFVSSTNKSFVYRINKPTDMELVFDVNKLGDDRRWGRNYNVTLEGDRTVIRFTKKTDSREDSTNGRDEYTFFIVINKIGKIIKRWDEKVYRDEHRDSADYSRLLFRAISLWDSDVIITANQDLNDAMDANRRVETQLHSIIAAERATVERYSVYPLDVAAAAWVLNHFGSMHRLTTHDILAQRARVLLGLDITDRLVHYLRSITPDGYILHDLSSVSDARTSDGIGLLFLRLLDVVPQLSRDERHLAQQKIAHVIDLQEKRMVHGLLSTQHASLLSSPDTSLELQVLQCALYNAGYLLTKNVAYLEAEKALRAAIRKLFWNGQTLACGLADFSVSSSIFLAAYYYPALLSAEEWKTCFTAALNQLWLDWGGIKEHGSSRLWMNNIAAIVLNRTHRSFFKEYVDKIYAASSIELLWKGCLGVSAELSDADVLRSQDGVSVLSAATFIELANELGKMKNTTASGGAFATNKNRNYNN